MKRIRHLRKLYFRWGRVLGLDAHECALILERAGLIERIGPSHYAETGLAKSIDRSQYDQFVRDLLINGGR